MEPTTSQLLSGGKSSSGEAEVEATISQLSLGSGISVDEEVMRTSLLNVSSPLIMFSASSFRIALLLLLIDHLSRFFPAFSFWSACGTSWSSHCFPSACPVFSLQSADEGLPKMRSTRTSLQNYKSKSHLKRPLGVRLWDFSCPYFFRKTTFYWNQSFKFTIDLCTCKNSLIS